MSNQSMFGSELKFIVSHDAATAVRQWARSELAPDPHAVRFGGDGYQTSSLYFDTEDLALYFRRGSYARAKYRVRSYNQADTVFLERKMKAAGRVLKRRSQVLREELILLKDPNAGWAGRWFARRLQLRQLRPICQITYNRTARVGDLGVRLTIDERLSASQTDSITFCRNRGIDVLPRQAILELKYRGEPPAVFQQFIREFGLEPHAMSKYRMSIGALGLSRDKAVALHAG
jgi:VTC domain-containing protein